MGILDVLKTPINLQLWHQRNSKFVLRKENRRKQLQELLERRKEQLKLQKYLPEKLDQIETELQKKYKGKKVKFKVKKHKNTVQKLNEEGSLFLTLIVIFRTEEAQRIHWFHCKSDSV